MQLQIRTLQVSPNQWEARIVKPCYNLLSYAESSEGAVLGVIQDLLRKEKQDVIEEDTSMVRFQVTPIYYTENFRYFLAQI